MGAGTNYAFVENDVCKYLVDWPTGATYKDELIFDVNLVDRTTLYLVITSSYSDSNI